jgi:hypothetical protein
MKIIMRYISVADAVHRSGLRLVLGSGVPGPWSEAVKAIFDVKGIEYIPVEQHIGTEDPALFKWTGQYAAPVAMFEVERPRTRWYEILALAERLSKEPALIPENESDRVEMVGLTHEICAEDGLGWSYRKYFLESHMKRGNSRAESAYTDQFRVLCSRYVETFDADRAMMRMKSILTVLSEHLNANRARGNRFFVGDHVTAADVYWTAFSTLFSPFPPEQCPMPQSYRDAGLRMGELIRDVLDPALIVHRDRILTEYFTLPMCF